MVRRIPHLGGVATQRAMLPTTRLEDPRADEHAGRQQGPQQPVHDRIGQRMALYQLRDGDDHCGAHEHQQEAAKPEYGSHRSLPE